MVTGQFLATSLFITSALNPCDLGEFAAGKLLQKVELENRYSAPQVQGLGARQSGFLTH